MANIYSRNFYTVSNNSVPSGYTNLDGGGLYISNNTTPISLTNQGTFYIIQTNWVAGYSSNTVLNPPNGTITSQVTGNFMVTCSLTIATSSDLIQFQVFKNGSPVPNCIENITPGSYAPSFVYCVSISGIVPLTNKDVLDIRVNTVSVSPETVTIQYGSFSISSLLYSSGSNIIIGGDLRPITSTSQRVIAIQGNAVATGAPTSGQFLVERSIATGSAWTSLSGDVTNSSSVPGKLTVVGLQNNPLPVPSGSNTFLNWNGSLSWQPVAGSNPTFANVFGDGSDGNATCDGVATVVGMSLSGGNYTLTRDVYFHTLTVNTGVSINTLSQRIFVNSTLTNNGHINADGGNGASSSGGSSTGGAGGGLGIGNGRLGSGAAGGASNQSGGTSSNSAGGQGGSGNGSFYPFNGTLVPLATEYGSPRDLLSAINGYVAGLAGGLSAIVVFNGGSGGGGGVSTTFGGDVAGGGGGGGVCVVVANTLVGNGAITANGGNGGLGPLGSQSGNGAAGGGGGGGYCAVITHVSTSWTGTISANGGLAGFVGSRTLFGLPVRSTNGDNGLVEIFTV